MPEGTLLSFLFDNKLNSCCGWSHRLLEAFFHEDIVFRSHGFLPVAFRPGGACFIIRIRDYCSGLEPKDDWGKPSQPRPNKSKKGPPEKTPKKTSKSNPKMAPARQERRKKATATDSQKEVKGVDSKKLRRPIPALKKPYPTAEDDRPWLIKERSTKKPDTAAKKPAPLKWKDDAQQLHCKTQLKELQKALGKARTYSIRGDTCATAKHADDFLNLAGRLKTECPDGFLESNGYSEKIIQNLKVLSELGKKACLEK
jgi:hypothetical protein